MLSILIWWAAAEVLGLTCLPLAFRLFTGLPDRGYAFTKTLGLLLLGYVTWLVEILQFTDFTRGTVLFFLALLAAASWWFGRSRRRELRAFVRQHRGLILSYEALFLAAFVFLAWYRGFNPEIAGTEKPMDFALIDGILRSVRFPPMDPWMSGFPISYYYFGYYLVALVVRLTGVPLAIGFNLGLALIFALTALTVAGIVVNLTSRFRYGLLASFFTLLASNPDGLLRVLSYGTFTPAKFWWWWDSSRVVKSGCNGQCIDEFPQFSFMLGDLHPHVMALPFAALALGLGLAVLKRSEPLGWRRGDWPWLLLLPIAAGSLGFINTWDLPAYLAVIVVCVLWRQYVSGKVDWRPATWIVLASAGLYLPFYLGFHSQAAGIGLVQGQTTPTEFLRMWGFLFALALLGLLAMLRLSISRLAGLAGIGLVVLLLYRHWLVALLVPLALAALWTLWQGVRERKWRPEEDFALGLTALAFGLIAVCEVVFLKDTFNNRMNTVFKFYYEAWLLLSVAAAYAVWRIGSRLRSTSLQLAWRGVASLVCAAALVYPAASFYSKANELKPAWTLDGTAFMKSSSPGDLKAIDWLNRHVSGEAVIAEATGDEYSSFARFGTYTGLESILGWAGHELQWRGVWQEQPKRIADLQRLYTTQDAAEAANLLKEYDVSYVVAGQLERQKYGNRDFALFGRLGQVVFSQDGTTVYHITGASGTNQPRPVGVVNASNR